MKKKVENLVKASFGWMAVFASMMGIVTGATAMPENNSSLTPLIAQHLLADAAIATTSTPTTLQADAQGLLDYAQNLITGEELMFIMDVPYAPAQQTPIVLTQTAVGSTTPPAGFILNECQETEHTIDPRSALRTVDPAYMIKNYFQPTYNIDLSAITTTLLQSTKHGKLFSEVDNVGLTSYHYDPVPGYLGDDQAKFLAEFELGGKHLRIMIIVQIKVLITVNENEPVCPDPVMIKASKPATGDSGYSSGYNSASVSVTFADLASGALGQTTGSTITLDTTAAGNNWFIDLTPSDNSEYLPTSNPFEWVAKAGSAAAGKMDMLSVLLHEYGHALGIDHNTDAHDYMGTTLTAGLLQRNRYGGLNAVLNNSTFTQYDVAANATLTNGNLSSGNGWATQDSVTFNPSAFVTSDPASTSSGQASTGSGRTVASSATLNEISTSQTRLSQVFMVNANDRYLSPTLSGMALGSNDLSDVNL